jgi:trehalose-6-phosphatase
MAVGRRSLEDLREKVGVSGIIYVGNHGLEIENPVGRHNDNWSLWFKNWLHSRYYTKRASKTGAEAEDEEADDAANKDSALI